MIVKQIEIVCPYCKEKVQINIEFNPSYNIIHIRQFHYTCNCTQFFYQYGSINTKSNVMSWAETGKYSELMKLINDILKNEITE